MQGASSHVSATERHDMRACNCARASPFQSRTCEGCDPQLSIRQTMRISFNPCIRVGCDFRTRGEDGTSVPVSIHAPAWGATYRAVETLLQIRVSIHAPAWGATRRYSSRSWHWCHVSIHAPAWGATMPGKEDLFVSMVSIHAPAWGATFKLPFNVGVIGEFQSTHPRGVRLHG